MPEEVQGLIDGELGSTVTLTIKRYGIEPPIKFELERQRIEVRNVGYAGLVGDTKNIGYILLNHFSQGTADEVRKTIEDLTTSKQLHGIILDLRNNPGGLLEEAVGIVDKFIPQNQMVVETRGRQSKHNNIFSTKETPILPNMPLVVLQNGGSASASEIVAGAFQDYDRAVIMGEQSFGKGLVQTVTQLSYNTALKMTISRYYIPSGRSIQSITYTHDDKNSAVLKPDSLRKEFKTHNGRTVYDGNGIAPDIEVNDKEPSLLETSLLRENLFFDFANRYASRHDRLSESFGSDDLYNEFTAYVSDINFEYQTNSEKHLGKIDSLLNGIEGEGKEHIQELEKVINKKKRQQFVRKRSDLEKRLYLELIARYKGREGQTAAWLPHDKAVNDAISVLQNKVQYNSILAGSN